MRLVRIFTIVFMTSYIQKLAIQQLYAPMFKALLLFIVLIATIVAIKPINDTFFTSSKENIAPVLSSEDSIRLYIEKYKHLAMEEMKRSKIPASITLAQGILESRYGTSELAIYANNHFGIKMGDDWTGGKYYIQTNEWNKNLQRLEKKVACFRAYHSCTESYKHHSDFIRMRAHYADLFKLVITDYKGWAKGLKNAGYATDPDYAQKLISLVERFQLYNYDKQALKPKAAATAIKTSK